MGEEIAWGVGDGEAEASVEEGLIEGWATVQGMHDWSVGLIDRRSTVGRR